MDIVVNSTTPELASFIDSWNALLKAYDMEHYPSLWEHATGGRYRWLEVDFGGTRYYRIYERHDRGSQRSAYAFIDRTNGDVLKPASWKAPAKHARGNIFDSDNGMSAVGPHGARYL